MGADNLGTGVTNAIRWRIIIMVALRAILLAKILEHVSDWVSVCIKCGLPTLRV